MEDHCVVEIAPSVAESIEKSSSLIIWDKILKKLQNKFPKGIYN
jgi:hypothetical protein